MARIWKITPEWRSQTAVILGSGPSMTREIADVVRASGCRTIAVNNQAIDTYGTPALAPWADILYAADATWWQNNKVAVDQFKGKKVTIANQNGLIQAGVPNDAVAMEHGGVTGFDDRTSYIRTGSNGGFQAIHIAIHLGVARVLLCGFDMHGRRGEHWFGHHHWRVGHRSRYDLFIRYFNESAKAFMQRAEIINCTPDSSLKCFPFMDIKEALNGVPDMREDSEVCARECAQSSRGTGTVTAEASAGVP